MASKKVVLVSETNQGLRCKMRKKLPTKRPEFQIFLAFRDEEKSRESQATLQLLRGIFEAVQLDISNDGCR